MKRFVLIALLLLFPLTCYAGNISGVSIGGASQQDTQDGTPSGCPSGTYMFAWNGDHSSGTTYGCKDSGASSVDKSADGGTYEITSDYGEAGNGLRINADNEYVTWLVTGLDILTDDDCTVWFSVKIPAGGLSASAQIFESVADGNNYASMLVQSNEKQRGDYKGNGTLDTFWHGTAMSSGSFVRLAISWNQSEAGNDTALYNGSSWQETDSDIVDWGTNPDDFTLGANGLASNIAEDIYIDNVFIVSGYKAADPYSP